MIATFHWPENGFQTFTFLSFCSWRLCVFHFPPLNVFNIWCFFPDLQNQYQSTTNLFWQRFQIPGMLWQPENETSWLLSDFPVNFSQPHIIAFSPLFTNRGNPVLNIEISKINVKRLLSSCWIQQIQQTWCLKYQQLPLQPEDLSSSETQWKLVGTMRFPFCGSCLRWFEDEDKNYVPVVKSSTQICLTFCSG